MDENVISQMTKNQEASLVASIMISVIRDQAISSAYGKKLFDLKPGMVLSTYDIFVSDIASYLENKLSNYVENDALSYPLYSAEGDLLGQLSRLLIPCNQKSEWFKEYVDIANIKIDALDIEKDFFDNKDYIRHLRNSITHCRFQIVLDKSDFSQTKIIFYDIGKKKGKDVVTAKITMTNNNLVEVSKIIINNIYKKYLDDINWIIE